MKGRAMPGVVTKKALVTNLPAIMKLGGCKLVLAMLFAKSGTPFLTVYVKVVR